MNHVFLAIIIVLGIEAFTWQYHLGKEIERVDAEEALLNKELNKPFVDRTTPGPKP